MYFIKDLRLEIEKVDQEHFKIIDRSIIGGSLESAKKHQYDVLVKFEEGEVKLPLLVQKENIFSFKEIGKCFCDECLCVVFESNKGTIKKKLLYTPDLECAIVEHILKNPEDSDIMREYEKMQLFHKWGKTGEAKKMYFKLCAKVGAENVESLVTTQRF